MRLITYDSVVEVILREAPEFAASGAQLFRDNPFQVAAEFMGYLKRLLSAREQTEVAARIAEAFRLINLLAGSGDAMVQNLVEVGMLEALTDTPAGLLEARAKLDPEPKAWMEAMLKNWLRPPGHPDIEKQ